MWGLFFYYQRRIKMQWVPFISFLYHYCTCPMLHCIPLINLLSLDHNTVWLLRILFHVVSFRRPRGSGNWHTFSMVLRKGPINHCSLPIAYTEKYFIADMLLLFFRFEIFYLMPQSVFHWRLNSLIYSNSHVFLQFANERVKWCWVICTVSLYENSSRIYLHYSREIQNQF